MGLNDGFIDNVTCPNCGEDTIMRLQIKMDGVYMNDYVIGDSVSNEVLKTIRKSEAEFVQALSKDIGLNTKDIADIDLESKDGTAAVLGTAYRIGSHCSCGEAPENVPRVAVLEEGVFQGFSEELPDRGPIVTDRGAVFPRWMLQDSGLQSHILNMLEGFFGEK